MKIEGERYLQRPPLIKGSPTSHDNSKYCHFHHDHGHNTEDYFILKNEIENLIRQDYFGKFVRKERTQPGEQDTAKPPFQAEVNNRPTKKSISMISCG